MPLTQEERDLLVQVLRNNRFTIRDITIGEYGMPLNVSPYGIDSYAHFIYYHNEIGAITLGRRNSDSALSVSILVWPTNRHGVINHLRSHISLEHIEAALRELVATGHVNATTETCENCNEANEVIHLGESGLFLCPACISDQIVCRNCGSTVLGGDFNTAFRMCNTCVEIYTQECTECGHRTRDFTSVRDRGYWCRDCVADHAETCEDCGIVIDNEDAHYNYSDGPYCWRCYRRANSLVREYDTNVKEVLNRDCWPETTMQAKTLYYGVELETQVRSLFGNDDPYGREDSDIFTDVAGGVLEAIGRDFAILKRDGSLGDAGIEIVTLPARLQIHKERWANFFKHRPRDLRSWDGGACGVHVHIRKNVLSILTIGKMVVFLNDPANRTLILKVAGRYNSGFCVPKDYKGTYKKVVSNAEINGDKYEMLNLNPYETVELRIFRGSLNPDRFYSYLEFTELLIKFCRTTFATALDSPTFVKFVRGHKKAYPHLWKLLNSGVEESECA